MAKASPTCNSIMAIKIKSQLFTLSVSQCKLRSVVCANKRERRRERKGQVARYWQHLIESCISTHWQDYCAHLSWNLPYGLQQDLWHTHTNTPTHTHLQSVNSTHIPAHKSRPALELYMAFVLSLWLASGEVCVCVLPGVALHMWVCGCVCLGTDRRWQLC